MISRKNIFGISLSRSNLAGYFEKYSEAVSSQESLRFMNPSLSLFCSLSLFTIPVGDVSFYEFSHRTDFFAESNGLKADTQLADGVQPVLPQLG